ncbi:probable H/ACA ribonucleoprotein complex subunit 1 [Anopheles arabiensis]|uniref:probable H/ACA ribonucleoprotein complex subunit 1 n=1 Tax=Anopheles arabiensis TaxID=7173 RepID=UPI001AACD387|nr:probable H/ACA ribonucleoprotein complex subunit 1 [Anopheles arabiensis]
MSFRGRGGGGGGGGRGGGGSWGGRGGRGGGGGGRGGFNNRGSFGQRDDGPKNIIPLGYYDYPCQEDLVAKVEVENVPFFNAPIYMEGEKQIGKVDEIFGNLKDFYVSIKLNDNMKPDGFQQKQKLFIDSAKLLPLARFLPGNQTRRPAGRVGKPGGRGGRGGRGGGGGFGGGRGGGGFGGRGGGGGGFRGRGGGGGGGFGGGRGGGGGFRGNRGGGGGGGGNRW